MQISIKLIYLIFLSIGACFAQQIKLSHYFLQDGLSQSHVSDITQDKFGYMWFATHDGLNRFDGFNFKVFRHIPGDSTSLRGNWINKLYTDESGRIWSQLGIGGLSIYNPQTNNFTQLNQSLKLRSLRGNEITEMRAHRKGHVLIMTDAGIDRAGWELRLKGFSVLSSFKRSMLDSIQVNKIPVGFLKAELDSFSGIWAITSDHALIRLTQTKKNKINYKIVFSALEENIKNLKYEINKLYIDRGKNIWVANNVGQIRHYSVSADQSITENGTYQTKEFAPLVKIFSINKKIFFISSNGSIYKFENNYFQKMVTLSIWPEFALFDKDRTLWLISEEGKIASFNTVTSSSLLHSTQNNTNKPTRIISTFLDNSSNIWMGTSRKGILKFSPKKTKFSHYLSHLKKPLVTSFAEDKKGYIFVGTMGSGLYLFNPNQKTLHKILSAPNNISSIHQENVNTLWIGTTNGKIYKMGLHGNSDFKFVLDTKYSIRDLLVFDKHLYIATDGGGVIKFNLNTKQKSLFEINKDGNRTSSPFVWSLHKDKSNNIWIGLAAGGLIKYNPFSNHFTYFPANPKVKDALNNRTINTISEDEEGNLWLGTYSGGLNYLNRKNLTFSAITVKEGLSGNMICGIVPGSKNQLWLSTNNGITKFNSQSGQKTLYNINDGLQSNEFYPGAAFKSRDGHIYFGGINGFNVFYPDSINKNLAPPSLLITNFQIHNNPDTTATLYNLPMSGGETINLNYDQNYLTIEFIAIDYTAPKKNQYAYKLSPIDPSFLDVGNRHHASYNNLEPGDYQFIVKAANNDGVWNEQGISINLVIRPPFWKTVWFYLFISICTIGLAIFYHRRKIQSKLKYALEIERIREEEQTNIRAKTASDFHDEMGHRLTRISMLTELIRRKEKTDSPEFKHLLNQVSDNANNLYLGTRDFIWAIDPRNDSFFEMAIRMKDFGDELFDNSGTDFRVEGIDKHLSEINMTMDLRRQIPLIFKEGMTNILKHAKAKNVFLKFEALSSNCSITLKDDGNGFDKEHVSTGFGLKNMQDRAKKIGATIKIESHLAQGTQIICSINLTQTVGLIGKTKKSIIKK